MEQAVFCIFLFVGTFFTLAASITRITCVGDSITYGATIHDRTANCYPKALGGNYSVRNFGDEYEADLLAMVTHFQKLLSKSFIYLCLPVPVYQTRWGINEKTVKESVMPIIRKVAKDAKLPVIDIHKALSGKPEMFPDKIHPNAMGAKL